MSVSLLSAMFVCYFILIPIGRTFSFSVVKNFVNHIPSIIPAATALPKLTNQDGFSFLSWNVLLPNSKDNWWCEKMYQQHVPMNERRWLHRQNLLKEYLLKADADIVCIQEASGESFEEDFSFMHTYGYESVLHKKFRFRCATFFKNDKFGLELTSHRDRSLILSLNVKKSETITEDLSKTIGNQVIYVANCHLSGGAAPDRRLRQVFEVTEQFRKWKQVPLDNLRSATMAKKKDHNKIKKAEIEANRATNAAMIVAGDFNSDGDTAVRRLLVDGSVAPDFREGFYPNSVLTNVRRHQRLGSFADAAEVAYRANVCDGDYGDFGMRKGYREYQYRRPATYIVPSLSTLFLLPPPPPLAEAESPLSYEKDISHNDDLDRSIEMVLRDTKAQVVASVSTTATAASTPDVTVDKSSKEKVEKAAQVACDDVDCSLDTFLEALEKEDRKPSPQRTGNSNSKRPSTAPKSAKKESVAGQELVTVVTEEDLERMISRFTPSFSSMLDTLFHSLADVVVEESVESSEDLTVATTSTTNDNTSSSSNSISISAISESKLNEWLLSVNQVEGRGGMYRQAEALFNKMGEKGGEGTTTTTRSSSRYLSRSNFYSLFAYELAEGKWWQVAYDLTMSGFDIRTLEEVEDDEDVEDEDDNLKPSDSQEVASDGLSQQKRKKKRKPRRHYEGWLDYIYYSPGFLQLEALQAALTQDQAECIYRDGDALPNGWWPSDHLPVAGVFRWDRSGRGDTFNQNSTVV